MRFGYLDTFNDGILKGWAHDDELSHPPVLDIHIDDAHIGSVVALHYREDIKNAGYGDGYSGFYYALPPSYFDGVKHTLKIVFRDNNELLKNGSQTLAFINNETKIYQYLNERIASNYYWFLQKVSIDSEILYFEAWAVTLFEHKKPTAISINGTLVIDILIEHNITLSNRYRYNEVYTISGSCDINSISNSTCNNYRFSCHFGPLHQHNCENDYLYPVKTYPHPEISSKLRVQGKGANESSLFDIQGLTISNKLVKVITDTLHYKNDHNTKVLDWGCGCGRVGRFFSELFLCDFYGIDIDRENVNWCKSHISGNFTTISQDPPTHFEDHSFDIIYGISIFTHLTYNDHNKWMLELHRLLRPGGYLLFTIHGDLAWYYNNKLGSSAYVRLKDSGFLDTGKCWHLDDIDVDHERYRNIYINRNFIYNYWSKYFTVLDVAEAAISCHHDLVIVKAK